MHILDPLIWYNYANSLIEVMIATLDHVIHVYPQTVYMHADLQCSDTTAFLFLVSN